MHTNPLWWLFCQKRTQNWLLTSVAFSLNLFAALLEGVSFTLIWMSFSYLSGEMPDFLPDGIKKYLLGFKQIHLFSLFMLGAVVAQIFRSAFTYFGQMVTVLLTVNLQTTAQRTIYRRIFSLTFASVNQYKMGDLIHYATAPPTYFRFVTEGLNRVVVSIMMIVAYVFFMLKISPLLTCSTLALFALTVFVQKIVIAKIVSASKEQSGHMVELNKETAQNVSGLRTVHLFHLKDYILDKVEKTLQSIAQASLHLNKWNQLILPVNEVIAVVLVGSTMIIGLVLLGESEKQIFSLLITFLALTYRFGTRLQVMMSGCAEIAFNMGQVKRLEEILLDKDKECTDSSNKPVSIFNSHISFTQTSLKYPGKEELAVHNLSLTIPKGETLALVGDSGGGKSSVLDLLLRLYEPSEGQIHVDDVPIVDYQLSSWRALFGVVTQDVFLFHETIEENIRFGKLNATTGEVIEAARLAGAETFIEQLPDKYQTVVGERGHRLSGGERQRISLARALVRKPQILVLDEATSNLDSQSEKMIQEALEKLKGKTTMIVVAHRLATINMADQILMLEKGRIVEQGTHADLIKLGGRYCHFWSLQTSQRQFLPASHAQS
ncbi:MAG: Heterocyst differentiation ATP-binding protein HepA [Chlamydiales bacterium]|nr:Heterocyst differentiation ATP-binding protein HepA [Chlamydiales bacterium]